MGAGVLTQRECWAAYDLVLTDDRISLLSEPRGLALRFHNVSDRDEISPKRWADDYILAFAEAANLTLVTFDRALAARASISILLRPSVSSELSSEVV